MSERESDMLRWGLQAGYLITVLLLPCLSVAATPYKWSDSQGRVHYGDRPPPNQAFEPIEVHPSPTPKTPANFAPKTEENAAEPATEPSAQENAAPPNAATSSRKQLMEENCRIAKRNLEILTTSGRRVQAMGGDGEPYVLDDNERELKLTETQKQIEKFCE
jgi:hypothetical protein